MIRSGEFGRPTEVKRGLQRTGEEEQLEELRKNSFRRRLAVTKIPPHVGVTAVKTVSLAIYASLAFLSVQRGR